MITSSPFDRFSDFRRCFPGATKATYLDVAGRGLISNEARAAIDAYLDERSGGGDKDKIVQSVGLARARFAALIGARESEIGFTKNVSDGINAVATAFEWKPGDNVVFCESLEHPSNLFTWYNLAERYGIELRRVRPVDGHIEPELVIAAIDERTKLVTAAFVTFAPGFRTELDAIGRACRAHGARLIVDAAQAIGIIDIDVKQAPFDALAVSTSKGLLGLYGMGFLYVRDEFADTLRPAYLSRFGVDIDSQHEASGATDYHLRRGAGRFDVGNYNYIGCVAAHASLEQLLAIGTKAIEARTLQLAGLLTRRLHDLSLPVMQTENANRRSHIVTVGSQLEDRHDATTDASLAFLNRILAERRIKLSIRRGLLRFSFHAYNNEVDVDATINAIASWQKGATARAS